MQRYNNFCKYASFLNKIVQNMLLNVQNAMIRQNNKTPDRKVGSSLLVVEYLTSDIKHLTSNDKHQTSFIRYPGWP